MRTVSFWLLVICMLFGYGGATAKVINYKPLSMSIQAGDELWVRGFAGNVKITCSSKYKVMQVKLGQKNPDKAPQFAGRSAKSGWIFKARDQKRIGVNF